MKNGLLGLTFISSFSLSAMEKEVLSNSAPFYCEVTCSKRTVKVFDILKDTRSVHTLYDRQTGLGARDIGKFFMTTLGEPEKLPEAITIPSEALDTGYATFSNAGQLDVNLQKKQYWEEAFRPYMKTYKEVMALANGGEAVVEDCKITSFKVNDVDQSIQTKVQSEFKTEPFIFKIYVVPLHVQFPGESSPRKAMVNFLTQLEYHPAPAHFNQELALNQLQRYIKVGLCRN